MRRRLNDIYREAAEEFARRVVAELGDEVDAVVLYGSVARGEARRESDIDILVVIQDGISTRDRLSELCYAFTAERDRFLFISLTDFTREEFCRCVQLGSPFLREILTEGVVLHDSGTFARVRQEGWPLKQWMMPVISWAMPA